MQFGEAEDAETDVVTRAIRDLATRQDGVIARRQLIALGVSARTIDRWIAAGRLVVVHRGVYAVGHAAVSPRGRRIAAVFAVAADAVLSHRTAAATWRLMSELHDWIELTVPGRTLRPRPGLIVHSVAAWEPGDVTRVPACRSPRRCARCSTSRRPSRPPPSSAR